MSPDPQLLNFAASKSSLYEKLDATQRAKLDRAIVDFNPASYKALFEKFQLTRFTVSYSAFYFYARRLREQANLLNLADLTGKSPASIAETLPDIINQHLTDLMMNESASPLDIQRCINAAGRAIRNQIEQIKLEQARKEAASPTAPGRRDLSRPGRRRPAEYDPSAPYGRDHDGTPNSREDWHRDLSRAVRRIYGIDFDAEEVARRAEAKQRPGREHFGNRPESASDPTVPAMGDAPDAAPAGASSMEEGAERHRSPIPRTEVDHPFSPDPLRRKSGVVVHDWTGDHDADDPAAPSHVRLPATEDEP